VILIVLDNRGYLSIRQTHENFFKHVVGATPESGVEFPDFAAVARAYGLTALRVDSTTDIEHLDAALARDGPVVIHLVVDAAQEFEPRLKSRILADGRFATPELDDMFPFLPEDEVAGIRAEGAAVRAVPSSN
jgi:acetolactate synthase-1/2/3 large subunit